MIEDDDLSEEIFSFLWWVVLLISTNVSSLDIFNWDVFNIETNIVSWNGFSQLFVMHFDGFDLSFNITWSKDDIHTWFKDTSFDSSDWDGSNTSDFVDIL